MGELTEIQEQMLAELVRIRKANEALAIHLGCGRQQASKQGQATSQRGGIATDRDLNGKYGDPEVRFDPRDWQGDTMKGYKFSQCPVAFLDLMAEALDDFADRETDPKKQSYKRADAARARGWSKRAGGQQAEQPPAEGDDLGV